MSDWRDDLLPYLPDALCAALRELPACAAEEARELRLRAERPAIVRGKQSLALVESLSARQIEQVAAAMLGHAPHARERELREGFVTLPGGHRAGLCGRVSAEGRLAETASLAVRLARQVLGAADALMPWLCAEGALRSLLLVSAPGMGKTTMLRDAARQISRMGWQVGIADERSELAACRGGVPSLDVGPDTDVLDGCPKARALEMLLRGMSPQALVTDEISGAEDAAAVLEAARCGVKMLASAHAGGFDDLTARMPERLVRSFDLVAVLGRHGCVTEIYSGGGKRLAQMDACVCGGNAVRGGRPKMARGDGSALSNAQGLAARVASLGK